MKIKLTEREPEKDEIIVFKVKKGFYPEIGVWETFDNGNKEIYIPANDDVELIENVEWWSPTPQNNTVKMIYKKRFLGDNSAYSLGGSPLVEFGILSDIEHFFPYSIKSFDADLDSFYITAWHVKYGNLVYSKQLTVSHEQLDDLGIDFYVNKLIESILK